MIDRKEEYTYTRDLIFKKEELAQDSNKYLKDFNNYYTKFMDLNEVENRDKETELARLDNGEKAAILIANYFDFSSDLLKNKRKEYVRFARNILYENAYKPNNDPDSMIFLIRALYGETTIAYNFDGQYRVTNLIDANEWVDYLERNTTKHVAKAYALTLRSYIYMVYGKEFGMTLKERIEKSQKDLTYATKWDPQHYLAYYALGLVYMDTANENYSKEKAIENFNKVLEFKDVLTPLDEYVTSKEKQKSMDNAKKKIEQLQSQK